MAGQLILTKDGSHTIEVREGLTYHSTFGAIQESQHIFIGAGLRAMRPGPLRVFEMGFGTGLNALLSLMEDRPIEYETVELEPLPAELVEELNYCLRLGRPNLQELFVKLHAAPWGEGTAEELRERAGELREQAATLRGEALESLGEALESRGEAVMPRGRAVEIRPGFVLEKRMADIRGYRLGRPADLVYYDAFDPAAQPQLWTEEVFDNLYRQLAPGAVLVTYCCKGVVRRALHKVGFTVEKLPGPPGKREMVRARKK